MKQRDPSHRYIVTQGCRYAWQCVKNCVKILIGRKLYRDERLVIYRRYILHRLGLRPMVAITCVNQDDEGAGSRAFHVIKTISLARASGLAYLHAPFTQIAHADRPMQEWAAAWEAVFNFGAGELPFDGRTNGVIDNGYRGTLDVDVYYGWRGGRDQLREHWRALIPEFRRRYYLNKSPRATDEVTVAVHIRRGDVSTDNAAGRYTTTETVLRITGAVKAILDARGVRASIRIFSEGEEKDFAELSPLGAEFFLNADPIWTFQELVEADILVVARSCFSHCAGFMSDGVKIFEGAWHWDLAPATDDWIPCSQDGLFDPAAFECQLSLLLEAKEKARLCMPG